MERSAVPPRGPGLLPPVDPERGALLGAGGVLLATSVAMIDARLDTAWSNGVHLIFALAAFVVVFGIALRSPILERPLAYQSTLALAGLALLVLVLDRLAQVFGVDSPFGNSGTILWMSAIFAGVAAFAAVRFQSLACALLTGVALAVVVLAFVDKVFNPSGVGTFRWILFLLALGFAAAAARLRQGPRPAYAVQAVNVAGLMLISLAATFAAAAVIAAVNPFAAGATAGVHAGFGWKAILVLGSLGVIAYAAAERERGPGYVGVVALFLAILVVAGPRGNATIVGWPLILLLAAIAALTLGLAPRPPGGRASARPRPRAAPGAPPPGAPPPAPETRQQPPGA